MAEPVERIASDQFSEGQSTPGMRRLEAIATGGMWAGVVHTEAGAVSGWHHHGEHESAIYVLSGGLRMESGPGGRDILDALPGDYLYVPTYSIHRERNPTGETATLFVTRAGHGEAVVNVDGPEAAG
jgi:uncharacterized RmlC-like cupin family protein